MKIRQIRLAAYGPFTDATLDLPADGLDFHLVFGPNEAGKSSALRALRHMLFGIPDRTAVDFLHSYGNLRIGARLVNGNGEAISFLRRKGRVKTLRGADDEAVLEDDALDPFLGGVTADVFEQMFAIGHEDLVRGGEEIISGKGSVGQALFAAGAGLIRLQHVQKDLERQCAELFKPGGSTPAINQAIREIKNARQLQKDALLPARTWQENDQARRDAQNRLDEVKERLAACRRSKARLERIREALPLIARKKELEAELAAYQGVPDLIDDFGDQCRDAQKELKIAVRDLSRAQEAIGSIRREIDRLPPQATLLDHAAAVEALQQELGSYRKAQKDKPEREGRMRNLQSQAAGMLAEIGPEIDPEIRIGMPGEAAAQLKLPTSAVAEVQELGKTFERLTARRESAAEQQRQRELLFSQLSGQRRAMPDPVEVTRLEHALQSAMEAGPIDKQLADLRVTHQALLEELNRALKRQTLWSGSLERVDELPLPARETIDQFDVRFDDLRRTLEKLRENQTSTAAEIARTRADLQALDLAREVPTEADLKNARGLRDTGWGLIRRTLAGETPPVEASQEMLRRFEEATLPDAFEKSMARADQVADRLWREADQVSQKGLLEARKDRLEAALGETAAAFAQALARQEELQAEWQRLWQPVGIVPRSAREMRAWVSEVAALREKLEALRAAERQAERMAAQRAALGAELLAGLADAGLVQDPGASLGALVNTARARTQAQKELQSNIAAADKELRRLDRERQQGASELAALEGALSQWRTDWAASLRKIGIRPDATPTAALAVIERVRDIKSKRDEAEVLRKRIEGMNRDSSQFISRVQRLVDALAPDLETEPMDRAAEQLYARLTQARKDEARRQGLAERLEATRKDLDKAEKRCFQCRIVIESLCQEARCATAEGLTEVEQRARRRNTLLRERDDSVRQLRKLSAGATVEHFIAEAAAVEADRIDPELQELEAENQALEAERSALDQKIGALTARLEQMDGRSQAALHAEEAERLLAGLECDVETYARLKIASLILSRTVEQYREKHQGPLISRASELFGRMTLGAFSRLRADYNDKGNPVLVGIRARNDAQVHVAGMSDGTADQLYLALRLASLEQYLAHNEPLPFVVDDILLRFDDQRALATLTVLAELAAKTQVLFFTHHQHLVDLAQRHREAGLDFKLHHL